MVKLAIATCCFARQTRQNEGIIPSRPAHFPFDTRPASNSLVAHLIQGREADSATFIDDTFL
ncbi:hypothetical protein PCASD_15982 [Puccinia coronata f. sp. avenae]|uniref:Uncharacterized protein n=1 Tax=Puccinia coronata f. sp. avenae TaxID=200324 RepID=A0A2N5TVL0_9BASI|nr:hypothetical protein PCASD_22305 [Puccinia coronata f. sp. avenae]PLW29541.1 hypothetical protein PCASD_15982 [Puccinia coronata f. sp. avenae]